MRPDEIAGLREHAATIWTPQSMLEVRERFERVRADARAGRRSRVLFLIPPNNKCAGPLYEIVLMFETWLRREGAREQVDITWSTFEQSYIQAFGPRLHEVVTAEFAERGIEGHTDEVVTEVGALAELYAYYERNEAMWTNVLRDETLVDALPPVLAGFWAYLDDAAGALAAGWGTRGAPRRVLLAATRHAVDFHTWRPVDPRRPARPRGRGRARLRDDHPRRRRERRQGRISLAHAVAAMRAYRPFDLDPWWKENEQEALVDLGPLRTGC